jgi:hypothetical protein
MSNWEKAETHPSWGMIGAYHTSGGARQLFGSDVSNHNTVMIKIKHAQKSRDLGRDWTMGTDTICEIELTALQFAEFLTNMNVGDGVPCTVRYTCNDGNIKYQEEKSKVDVILTERDHIVDRASSSLKEVGIELADLINNKKIPKSVGNSLLHKLSTALSDLEGSNFEFYRKQAAKEIDTLVVEAKSQISEYVASKIYSVGLEALVNAADATPKLNGAEREEIK